MTQIQNGSTIVSQNDTTPISFWCSECEFASFLLPLLRPLWSCFAITQTTPCIHLTLSPQMVLPANGVASQVHPTFSFICPRHSSYASSTNENYLSDIMFPLSQDRVTSSTTAQPGSKSVVCRFLAPISVVCLRNIKVSGYPYLYHPHIPLPLSHHTVPIFSCHQNWCWDQERQGWKLCSSNRRRHGTDEV